MLLYSMYIIYIFLSLCPVPAEVGGVDSGSVGSGRGRRGAGRGRSRRSRGARTGPRPLLPSTPLQQIKLFIKKPVQTGTGSFPQT